MKVEVSYDKENDDILFTEIRRKNIKIDSFFSEKLYVGKEEESAKEFKAIIAKTYLIVDFPRMKSIEDFKRWLCKEEGNKLAELLKEVCRIVEDAKGQASLEYLLLTLVILFLSLVAFLLFIKTASWVVG